MSESASERNNTARRKKKKTWNNNKRCQKGAAQRQNIHREREIATGGNQLLHLGFVVMVAETRGGEETRKQSLSFFFRRRDATERETETGVRRGTRKGKTDRLQAYTAEECEGHAMEIVLREGSHENETR